MTQHDFSVASSGAALLGFVAIALFFFKFWSRSGTPLFAWFALAFLVLAAERALLLTLPEAWAHRPLFYCTRLVAFAIIGVAILNQNRTRR